MLSRLAAYSQDEALQGRWSRDPQIVIDHNLKWSSHVDEICTKASRRLHFLKELKRSAVSVDDLYYFYVSAIRPVLEYACPVWHTSLTKEQTKQVESVQKRAFRIIYNSIIA